MDCQCPDQLLTDMSFDILVEKYYQLIAFNNNRKFLKLEADTGTVFDPIIYVLFLAEQRYSAWSRHGIKWEISNVYLPAWQ